MPDLEREIMSLRGAIDPGWDSSRSERLYAGLGQLRRRRAVRRAGVSGALALAAVVALMIGMPQGEAPVARKLPVMAPSAVAVAPQAAEHAAMLRLSDGSSARVLEAGSELRVMRDEPAHVELELLHGRAHFEVVPNHDRTFVVNAGAHRVVVVGTAFEVERTSDDRVRVQVTHGRVRIEGPDAGELGAGEERWLRNEVSRDEAPSETTEAAREVVAPKRVEPKPAAPDWRSLVQSGDHDAAYEALGRVIVEDDPWALMDAADAARLSGHPAEAVGYLDRVVRDHRDSAVAALAAFTAGRVRLERLGDPHAAADAFVTARALAPTGSLAQDALAREVEARSKAGDTHKANALAREYLDKYPEGARVRAVRLFGGIE